jgi:hypothetical protein
VYPGGHPLSVRVGDADYLYFARGLPLWRVKAQRASYLDVGQCEAYTCLKEGATLERPEVDRDEQGAIRYLWRRNTPALGCKEQNDFVKGGYLKPEEALIQTQDVETGKPILIHGGSVYWNEYRGRWVMIALEGWGTSMLGEVWYLEADTPVGPWVYARKVVTHEQYSFYNPKQHPEFAQDGGRVIYFQGTYSEFVSGNPTPTPYYDYNQIMYRLDLADARLVLPVPVYRTGASDKPFMTRRDVAAPAGLSAAPAFFACDRPGPGLVPVYLGGAQPAAFYALAPDTDVKQATAAGLYQAGAAGYATDPNEIEPGSGRPAKPLCYVWRNPLSPAIRFGLGEVTPR